MKVKGNLEVHELVDTEKEKMIRIHLGDVRCPRCHRTGTLVIYVAYKEGETSFDVRIAHFREGREKGCFLALELNESRDEAIILPEITDVTEF